MGSCCGVPGETFTSLGRRAERQRAEKHPNYQLMSSNTVESSALLEYLVGERYNYWSTAVENSTLLE